MVSNSQWGVRGGTLIILLLWPVSDRRAVQGGLGGDVRFAGKPCNKGIHLVDLVTMQTQMLNEQQTGSEGVFL